MSFNLPKRAPGPSAEMPIYPPQLSTTQPRLSTIDQIVVGLPNMVSCNSTAAPHMYMQPRMERPCAIDTTNNCHSQHLDNTTLLRPDHEAPANPPQVQFAAILPLTPHSLNLNCTHTMLGNPLIEFFTIPHAFVSPAIKSRSRETRPKVQGYAAPKASQTLHSTPHTTQVT